VSDLPEKVRELRASGLNAFAISNVLGVDLSEVRRAEDPRAQAAHERWAQAREAGDDAVRIFEAGE
jgi:hypothetical protein